MDAGEIVFSFANDTVGNRKGLEEEGLR